MIIFQGGMGELQSIEREAVQEKINEFLNKDAYFHLETSTGSYAGLKDPNKIATCAYIRNGILNFKEGKIIGIGSVYRVGLKLTDGWLYAEGLTDWEVTDEGKLLLGGYDSEGHLNIALELSSHPFECGA